MGLLYAQVWKDSGLLTMEKWLVKLIQLLELDKLAPFVRKRISAFIGDWKFFVEFFLKIEKKCDLWF